MHKWLARPLARTSDGSGSQLVRKLLSWRDASGKAWARRTCIFAEPFKVDEGDYEALG